MVALAPSVIVDIEMLVLVERVTHSQSLAEYSRLWPMMLQGRIGFCGCVGCL